jgi:hypothetical protein
MKEIRLSLSEDDFAELCQTGCVKFHPKSLEKIEISKDQFADLIDGGVITVYYDMRTRHKTTETFNVKIALQDIGYDRILMYVSRSHVF